MKYGNQRGATDVRKDRILRLLRMRDRLTVSELSELLAVSAVTIRKDLDQLEQHGLLSRMHGGAVMPGHRYARRHVACRAQQLAHERRVAAAAAKLVQPGQSIFLDASSIGVQIARLLKDSTDLRVVTAGLDPALELACAAGVNTVVVGGALRHGSSALVGCLAVEMAQQLSVDIGFFCAQGVSARHGLSDSDVDEAQLKRQLVRAASVVVGVANASALGTTAFSAFALPHEISRIITASAAPRTAVEALRSRAIAVDLV